MNPWAWTGRNPYHCTAFQILGLDPSIDRTTIRSRIAARRKRIAYNAEGFPLFGETLSVAQVNAAEEELATPRTRLAAELLTHRPEPGGSDLADLTELLELSRSLGPPNPATAWEDPASGQNWLYLAALPPLLPDPSDPSR